MYLFMLYIVCILYICVVCVFHSKSLKGFYLVTCCFTLFCLFAHVLFSYFLNNSVPLSIEKSGMGVTAHTRCFHWKKQCWRFDSTFQEKSEFGHLPVEDWGSGALMMWPRELVQVTTLMKVWLKFHSHGWLLGCNMFGKKEKIKCCKNVHIFQHTPWRDMLQGFQVWILVLWATV